MVEKDQGPASWAATTGESAWCDADTALVSVRDPVVVHGLGIQHLLWSLIDDA
jgi:hypothetical protein